MRLTIKTFLTVRMSSGERKTFLSGGEPCHYEKSGYESVKEMRIELRRRNSETHEAEDINNGIKLTPRTGFGHNYAWQEITLSE